MLPRGRLCWFNLITPQKYAILNEVKKKKMIIIIKRSGELEIFSVPFLSFLLVIKHRSFTPGLEE
jgi:hypothetical protein